VKLDLIPSNGFLLSAVYGLGYRLESIDANLLNSLYNSTSQSE